MRRKVLITAFGLAAVTAGASWANTSMKSTMRDWKAGLAAMESAVAGGGAYDRGEMSRLASRLSDEAGRMSARIHGASAQAEDVKRRFDRLASSAQSLAEAGARTEARARYGDLRAVCVGCHDTYAR